MPDATPDPSTWISDDVEDASRGAGAKTPAPQFTPEDVPQIFNEPKFKSADPEARRATLNTVLSGAFDNLTRDLSFNADAFKQWGRIAAQAHEKLDAMETTGEKAKHLAMVPVNMATGLAKDAGTAAAAGTAAIGEAMGDDTLKGVGNAYAASLGQGVMQLVDTAVTSTVNRPPKDLRSEIESLKHDVDSGNVPVQDPASLGKWISDRSSAIENQISKWWGGSPAIGRGIVDNPQNATLFLNYVHTRDPEAWKQLESNFVKSRVRVGIEEDRQKTMDSEGAKNFDNAVASVGDVFGANWSGASQHLQGASDPLTIAGFLIPALRGAKTAAAADTLLGRTGQALAGAAKGAPLNFALGAASTLNQNPNSTLGDLAKGGAEMAAGGAVIHTAAALPNILLGKAPNGEGTALSAVKDVDASKAAADIAGRAAQSVDPETAAAVKQIFKLPEKSDHPSPENTATVDVTPKELPENEASAPDSKANDPSAAVLDAIGEEPGKVTIAEERQPAPKQEDGREPPAIESSRTDSKPIESTAEEPSVSAVDNHPIVEAPISKLKLSEDIPQFKAGANEKGVVEPLQGKFERVGTGPIQVWRRLNGDLEIISGRHRFDLAERSGEDTIPAQIHDEAAGFDAAQAARLDAELNIRDGNGTVADYANYFHNADVSEAEANAKGILGRAKGAAGYRIGTQASEDVFALHQSGRITDSQADAIARSAPGDARAQSVGVRAALEGKSADVVANTIKAARLAASERAAAGQQGDLFGFDDSALKEMERNARNAADAQKAIREQIKATEGAAKKPDVAAKLGVDVKDPEGLRNRIAELKAEQARWDNWTMHPDLRDQVRGKSEAPTLRPNEGQGDLLQGGNEPFNLVSETAQERAARESAEKAAADKKAADDAAKAKAEAEKNQGQLFAEPAKVEEAKTQLNAAIDELKAEPDSTEKQGAVLDAKDKLDTAENTGAPKSALEQWAEDTLRRELGKTNLGFSPDAALAAVVKGASLFARGAKKFADWTAAMLKEFGGRIRQFLPVIWQHIQNYGRDLVSVAKSDRGSVMNPFWKMTRPAPKPLLDAVKERARETKDAIAQALKAGRPKSMIAALKDAAPQLADQTALQAANHIRLAFGEDPTKAPDSDVNIHAKLNEEAATYVADAYAGARAEKVNAGADPKTVTVSPAEAKDMLTQQLADVRAGTDIVNKNRAVMMREYALENFDPLDKMRQIAHKFTDAEVAVERANGFDTPKVEDYFQRVYTNADDLHGADVPEMLYTPGGDGSSRAFMKERAFDTLTEAELAGYDPKSINIADLAQHRIAVGQRMIENKNVRDTLFQQTDPTTGAAILKPMSQTGKMDPNYKVVNMGGTDVQVYKPFAGLIEDLYGRSALRNSLATRSLLKGAYLIKHTGLLIDTYHAARVSARQFFATGRVGYNRGLSMLEYAPSDLAKLEHLGYITPEEAQFARDNHQHVENLLKAGANFNRLSDALDREVMGTVAGALKDVPVIGALMKAGSTFNNWVFQKLTRGAMVETAVTFAKRYLENGMDAGEAYRRAAVETNEMFGNVNSQGVLRSKTMQDFARLVLLAPQWTEGTFRSEFRGAGQLARHPLQALLGTGANVARTMGGTFLALLLANQAINLATKGKPTWENEEGHSLDAFVPGGKHGFWFSPFSYVTPYVEQFSRYYNERGSHKTFDEKALSAWQAATQIGYNKLSPMARAATVMATGRDYYDRPLPGMSGRTTEALNNIAFTPIFLSPFIKRDPGKFPSLSWENSPGAWQKQMAASLGGAHLIPAQTATQKMYQLARPFRDDASGHDPTPSKFTGLRRALDVGDETTAAREIINTLQSGAATWDHMTKAVEGQRPFTGSDKTEAEFIQTLTPDQRQTYIDSLHEHKVAASLFAKVAQDHAAEIRDAIRAGAKK